MEPMIQERPIPHAVLKIQLKKLVEQTSSRGLVYTKDLLSLIDKYETTEQVLLLTEVQKKAILPYTKLNPDLEMTPNDILNLLKLVCPSPMVSMSAPTSHIDLDVRPRTSSPLTSFARKRRPSNIETYVAPSDLAIPQEQQMTTSQNDTDTEKDQSSNQEIARYYRRSLKLTQRLKSSEQSLAYMARDNEDRITELQNKVEDMNLEVIKQRKEIQEYKGKEKNSLDQISALELHISKIERSETDQKQVYMSIKQLFDDKCQETQKLQELLRQKESDLENTEELLKNFKREVDTLSQERTRLLHLQNSLELELETNAQAHKQLQEQKNENEKLKEIIDSLKTDLDEALYHQDEEEESHGKTLEIELVAEEDERLKSVEDEKEYYKNRANEAMQNLGRVKSELDYLRKALDSENRALVNELAELKLKKSSSALVLPTAVIPPLSPSTSDTTSATTAPILNTIELNTIIPDPPIIDVWANSRIRNYGNKTTHRQKKRTVQDLHESSSSAMLLPTTKNKETKTLTKKDDKIVANTVTFALYTLLVYFFGIVTSTFLLDGSAPQSSWEQALVAAASGQVPKSKVLEIVLYWIEKLLFEPEGLPVS